MEDGLNSLIADYLHSIGLYNTGECLTVELNSKKALVSGEKRVVLQQLLQFFDRGEKDQFWSLWHRFVPETWVQENSDCFVLVFKLHLLFGTSKWRFQEAPDLMNDGLPQFQAFVHANSDQLAEHEDLLPLTTLSLIKNPTKHAQYSFLFEGDDEHGPSWTTSLRSELEVFWTHIQQQRPGLLRVYHDHIAGESLKSKEADFCRKQMLETLSLAQKSIALNIKLLQELPDGQVAERAKLMVNALHSEFENSLTNSNLGPLIRFIPSQPIAVPQLVEACLSTDAFHYASALHCLSCLLSRVYMGGNVTSGRVLSRVQEQSGADACALLLHSDVFSWLSAVLPEATAGDILKFACCLTGWRDGRKYLLRHPMQGIMELLLRAPADARGFAVLFVHRCCLESDGIKALWSAGAVPLLHQWLASYRKAELGWEVECTLAAWISVLSYLKSVHGESLEGSLDPSLPSLCECIISVLRRTPGPELHSLCLSALELAVLWERQVAKAKGLHHSLHELQSLKKESDPRVSAAISMIQMGPISAVKGRPVPPVVKEADVNVPAFCSMWVQDGRLLEQQIPAGFESFLQGLA